MLKIGDKVKLRTTKARETHDYKMSTVTELYKDIPGGVKLKDKIGGFYSWNEKDLQLIKQD